MSQNFYLTTTLPYVNAAPHLGFAWEILTADFICRFQKLTGAKVCFNTGTDEHGQKIYQKALSENLTPQAYVDQAARAFQNLPAALNLTVTHFIRTTDAQHLRAARELWRRCAASGDIYKKKYQVKYCVGCELEKTESELIDGHCPLHPQLELELRAEDNYFFRFSKYQQPLLALYQRHPDFVLGAGKMKEIINFVKRGLQDFSISRVKEKMPWGIPVPDDDTQVMYVWFDALVSYISTLSWPEKKEFSQFWPGRQICGKDNLRQQAAMWQAMLFSAKLPQSRQILVNGFITIDGQKMSKSLGNIISPQDLITRYGQEGTRFLLASLPVFSGDVDLTFTRLDDFYTANLAHGLGNLASRLAKLAADTPPIWSLKLPPHFSPKFAGKMEKYLINQALEVCVNSIHQLDQKLSSTKPWLITDQKQKWQILLPLAEKFLQLAYDLQIFLPKTSAYLLKHWQSKKIKPISPLFPRL